MIISITSIKLKGPFHFFALSLKALRIIRQLKSTECLAVKTKGIWTTHYTMTLWNNPGEMEAFARSGAHLAAMKTSKAIAKEIRIAQIQAAEFPDWKVAKEALKNGKGLQF